jgi:putative ABC transport system substrate-binding protein
MKSAPLPRLGIQAKKRTLLFALVMLSIICALTIEVHASEANYQPSQQSHSYNIGVLMSATHRQPRLEGFKQGLENHGNQYGTQYNYTVYLAEDGRKQLAELAQQVIANKPDLAIACGGIEADALRLASAGSGIPVVFLYAASSVERGLVNNMTKPGGNITGIDSNDTALTTKRLWYLKKILPRAQRITCFNIPSIRSSAASGLVAQKVATELGLSVRIIDIATKEQLGAAVNKQLAKTTTDAVLLLPCAPIFQVMVHDLTPKATSEGIPIFGAIDGNLESGAFATYSSNQKACGIQAARLAIRILHGAKPADIPVESPQQLELILNRAMIKKLDLKLPRALWQIADQVVDLEPH